MCVKVMYWRGSEMPYERLESAKTKELDVCDRKSSGVCIVCPKTCLRNERMPQPRCGKSCIPETTAGRYR